VKPNEIKDKPEAELLKLAGELKEEVFRLKFRQGTGQLKQTTSIRMTKRDLARVETELSARRRAQASKEES
jgi:large subunit ribosomal protein L29